MSVCIALRDDYDSIELRCLAKHSRDPRQVRENGRAIIPH